MEEDPPAGCGFGWELRGFLGVRWVRSGWEIQTARSAAQEEQGRVNPHTPNYFRKLQFLLIFLFLNRLICGLK